MLHTSSSSLIPERALLSSRRVWRLGAIGLLLLAVAFFLRSSDMRQTFVSQSEARVMAVLPNLKKFFTRNSAPQQIVEPVKVVHEESQVIDVVKKASGAVVSIVASAEVPRVVQCRQSLPEGLPPEFQGFFNLPSLCQQGTELRRVGAGSGFLVSSDGYIVTNKHVVANEKGEYTVIMNDEKHLGQRLKATVVARHPSNDIAILKVDVKDVPALSFADSSKLQVGQTAIAIGYALGEFDNTVSKGVVSGLLRRISANSGQGAEQLSGLIQTDAAINPGNSGGPLLDIEGNVIGMNTAVANAQSIGFALPANEARTAFEQARSSGQIKEKEQAFLGVRYVPITAELKAANNLAYDYGVLIGRGSDPNELAVTPGSPADKAGIVENDILLELNGQQLNERNLLGDLIAAHHPGETVELKLSHRGEVKTVKVTLGKR